MYFPFFILRHGGKRPAAQPQMIYSEFPLEKNGKQAQKQLREKCRCVMM